MSSNIVALSILLLLGSGSAHYIDARVKAFMVSHEDSASIQVSVYSNTAKNKRSLHIIVTLGTGNEAFYTDVAWSNEAKSLEGASDGCVWMVAMSFIHKNCSNLYEIGTK